MKRISISNKVLHNPLGNMIGRRAVSDTLAGLQHQQQQQHQHATSPPLSPHSPSTEHSVVQHASSNGTNPLSTAVSSFSPSSYSYRHHQTPPSEKGHTSPRALEDEREGSISDGEDALSPVTSPRSDQPSKFSESGQHATHAHVVSRFTNARNPPPKIT